jgi:predicted Zn-dependent protease
VRLRAAVAASLVLLLSLPVPPAAEAAVPGADIFEKSVRAAAEAVRIYGEWDEPEQLRRVTDMGYRIAQESGFRDLPLSFYLIDLPEPNAFALPGGQIFVTRGLIAVGLGDDELAALLGHEIAHVVGRHGIRMERRATLLNVLSQAALVGVILGAERGARDNRGAQLPYPYNLERQDDFGTLVTGTYAAGVIVSELLLRSYSRDFEDEADADGQRWASAAGFAVDGTERLMAVLGSRLPDSKEYGYWRTHPFFEQRTAVAKVRARTLTQGRARAADEYRSWSQKRILELGSGLASHPPAAQLVESAALAAWPRGVEAERIRVARLHRTRSETLERLPLSRDYGRLLAAYDRQLTEVRAVDRASSLPMQLEEERAELAADSAALLPQARQVWKEGVYQTVFLENFLSNWPEAEETTEVALALGEAYSRSERQADAVAMFLRAEQGGDATAERARRGLRQLAPHLDQLTALADLAAQEQDPDLAGAAAARLAQIAATYSDLSAGAAYLARFPDGEHAATVSARLNVLADNLYGEILLYQGIGDHLKAIDRIQKLLAHAPGSPAAQKLLEKVVLPS